MPDTDPRPLWAKAPATLIFDGQWTRTDLRVYLYLDFRAGRRGWYRVTQKTIAEELKLGRRAVEKAIPRLRDGGLITTERHGNLDGEITYRIIARVPHESAVPLEPVPHSDSDRFRTPDRNRRSASVLQRSKTSTTEDLNQAMQIHRDRAREA